MRRKLNHRKQFAFAAIIVADISTVISLRGLDIFLRGVLNSIAPVVNSTKGKQRMTRFQTRELIGYLSARTNGGRAQEGLTVIVVDTLTNYKVMGQFRTEDHNGIAGYMRNAIVREEADKLAAKLNAM